MITPSTLREWLEVGCLAPSPHNNQPWQVSVGDDAVAVRLDARYLPALGPDRLQFMALGAFIENVGYAASADGFAMSVRPLPLVPRRDLSVVLDFVADAASQAEGAVLVEAARRRRTNRGPYEPELPPSSVAALEAVRVEEGTSVCLVTDADSQELAAGLAGRAMEIVFTLDDTRADLAPYVIGAADPRLPSGCLLPQ